MTVQLMLLPTTTCQANCTYCFGPRFSRPAMNQRVLEAVENWLGAQPQEDSLHITFHGGEPLIEGYDFFRMALPRLQRAWRQPVSFSVQSNLWLLNRELCELFAEYQVGLGTSLDGPEGIHDSQRGRGAFKKTRAGIELAKAYGLRVGCIATFTAQSMPHWQEIVDFFRKEGMSFSVHAATPGLVKGTIGGLDHPWKLSPELYGELLVQLFDDYIENLDIVRIASLDAMCQSVTAGKGGICTFTDCLGKYLAIGPDGGIYPCQRFVGHEMYRLGTVIDDQPIEESPAWKRLVLRQAQVQEACGVCEFQDICKGGCAYDALAAGSVRDPYCASYRRIFNVIVERGVAEVLAEENLAVVLEQPGSLLRKGKVISLLRGRN